MDEPKHPKPDVIPVAMDLERLVECARHGDPLAISRLREYLANHPEMWQKLGDLAAQTQHAWIRLVAGNDAVATEALGRTLEAFKAELAGLAPTPLERLLVERVAACWLQLQHADHAAAQCLKAPLNIAKFALSRQSQIHRSYLMALGALATVRRLLPHSTSSPSGGDGPADVAQAACARSAVGVVAAPQRLTLVIDEPEVDDRPAVEPNGAQGLSSDHNGQ